MEEEASTSETRLRGRPRRNDDKRLNGSDAVVVDWKRKGENELPGDAPP